MATPTPHDALFKRVFSQPQHASGELRHLLPPAVVARIDWQSLKLVSGSVVDEQHRDHHADLLYEVRISGRRALLYVLFEHKSRPERRTPFQLLVYEVRIWESFLAANPRARKLPMILPVVVHHGERGWTAGRDLREMILVPADLRESLDPLLPSFPFLLDDLTSESPDRLRGRAISEIAMLTLFCFARAQSGDLLGELEQWADVLKAVYSAPDGATALSDVILYISTVTTLRTDEVCQFMSATVGPETEQLVKSTYDKLVKKGHAEGRAEGRAEGHAEGRVEGRAAMLVKLLEARFGTLPADAAERVSRASAEQLDLWAVAALRAERLQDVFAAS